MSPSYDQPPSYPRLIVARDVAAQALYRAELALHDAQGTGIAEWVSAANDRLHQAVVRYEAAMAEIASQARRTAAA
jgi:hypothetical protein